MSYLEFPNGYAETKAAAKKNSLMRSEEETPAYVLVEPITNRKVPTMDSLPDGITQEQLDRYVKLDRGIKKLSVEHKELNAQIKEAFTKLGTFLFGKVVVKRTEAKGSTFDAVLFAAQYPLKDKANRKYYAAQVNPDAIPDEIKKLFTTNKVTQKLSVELAE